MSRTAITIEHYRAVLAGAERMLGHARRLHWEMVGDAARELAGLTTAMQGADARSLPDDAARRERIEILARLVRIDGEIRHLRDPALARMDSLLCPAGGPWRWPVQPGPGN